MTLFQKQPKTSGYKTVPNASTADEETVAVAVPLGTTTLSPSTIMGGTMDRRSSKGRRIAHVAAMIMLVMVAGGMVWMRPEGESSDPTNAEGLVVATTDGEEISCVPATGTWTAGKVSTTVYSGQATPFLTCWQSEHTYCWTRSTQQTQCIPDGEGWVLGDPFIFHYKFIDYWRCGRPCKDMHYGWCYSATFCS